MSGRHHREAAADVVDVAQVVVGAADDVDIARAVLLELQRRLRPRKPAPPVTRTRSGASPASRSDRSGSLPPTFEDAFHDERGLDAEVTRSLEHDPDEVVELHLRLPAQLLARLRGIAAELVDFVGAQVALVESHEWRQSRPTREKAVSTSSSTECDSPVATT